MVSLLTLSVCFYADIDGRKYDRATRQRWCTYVPLGHKIGLGTHYPPTHTHSDDASFEPRLLLPPLSFPSSYLARLRRERERREVFERLVCPRNDRLTDLFVQRVCRGSLQGSAYGLRLVNHVSEAWSWGRRVGRQARAVAAALQEAKEEERGRQKQSRSRHEEEEEMVLVDELLGSVRAVSDASTRVWRAAGALGGSLQALCNVTEHGRATGWSLLEEARDADGTLRERQVWLSWPSSGTAVGDLQQTVEWMSDWSHRHVPT